jgi:hypothetical protein
MEFFLFHVHWPIFATVLMRAAATGLINIFAFRLIEIEQVRVDTKQYSIVVVYTAYRERAVADWSTTSLPT